MLTGMWNNYKGYTVKGVEFHTATLESFCVGCIKLKICMPYDPAIELLGIYPTEMHTCV